MIFQWITLTPFSTFAEQNQSLFEISFSGLNGSNCVEKVSKISKSIESTIEDRASLSDVSNENNSSLAINSFELKSKIRNALFSVNSFSAYLQKSPDAEECSLQLRDLFYDLNTYNQLTNSKTKNFLNTIPSDLEDGDIILVRSNTEFSALIAQTVQHPSQYNHLAIVHKTEKDRFVILESTMKKNVQAVSVNQFFLKKENTQFAIYRVKDKELAKSASHFLYQTYLDIIQKQGIWYYDQYYDDQDHAEVYCSELIQVAFEMVSNHSFKLPLYHSHFKNFDHKLFRQVGLTANQSIFHPGDIEIDPRFDLISEWTREDPIENLYLMDIATETLLQWMQGNFQRLESEAKNTYYDIFPTISQLLMRGGWWTAKKIPFFRSYYLPYKAPTQLSANAVGGFLKAQKVTRLLHKALLRADRSFYFEVKRHFTPNESKAFLEKFRQEDWLKFKKQRQSSNDSNKQATYMQNNGGRAPIPPLLHLYFRPKTTSTNSLR